METFSSELLILRETERKRMEQKLYEAAAEGKVASLQAILEDDRLVLERAMVACFNETPLHIAAMCGHTDFVKEILGRKSGLAGELNLQQSSPLHLASANGHVEIVKALLLVNPDMCLVGDGEGRNPLHLAAMKGRVDVLRELLRVGLNAARNTVDHGETILHLCVKQNQLGTLRLLMETLNDHQFLNSTDEFGNSILHLAVSHKQIQIIRYLVTFTSVGVNVNAINANGLTALDILAQSGRDVKDFDIADCLREAGASRARDINPTLLSNKQTRVPILAKLTQSGWLEKKRDILMVVASLIATMSFQAGVSPPGGVWQDDSEGKHRAGEAVMAYNYPDSYPYFLRFNTISFVTSLSTILLLMSGLPFKRKTFMWILMVIMWLTITSISLTYAFTIVVITPMKDREPLSHVITIAVIVWCCVMTLLLIGHTIRLIERWLWSRGILTLAKPNNNNNNNFKFKPSQWQQRGSSYSDDLNHDQ
ncbi:hypothetical protein F0562_001948 [Nyssa sinensis]|uniref:PGG domain-containing protein n=1 Tax=Nyssa sinensis TaxID=561372 RepID=A0A5J5C612_9ASTE|nr:hypothetical protein F0562_001948 [Nyssa sinensis]